MNNRLPVLGLILALVIGFSTISFAGAPLTGGNSAQAGNFSFDYSTSASVLNNVGYVTSNGTIALASSVYVNESASSTMNGMMFPSDAISLANGSVFSGDYGRMLVVVGTGLTPSITYVTDYALAKVSLNINATAWFGGFYNQRMNASTMSVYQMVLPDGAVAVLFSNSNSVQKSSNTVTFSSVSPPLFVGLVSKVGFVDYLKSRIMDTSRFTYNNTTGFVDGAHLSFYFNDGTITDFTSKWTNTNIFSSITVSGNGSLESNDKIPIIPFYTPIVIGGLFVYATNTSIFAIHDNPAIQSTFLVNNGTITFAVPMTLNVTVFNTTSGMNEGINESAVFQNNSESANMTMGLNNSMQAGRTTIYVHGGGFRGMMFVIGGQVNVNGNLISISTQTMERIQFVAPVGLQGSSERALHYIEQAIVNNEVGSIMEISSVNGSPNALSLQYNSSISMSLTNAGSGKVTLTVSSIDHRGNLVAIYVSNSLISNTSTVTVTIDGQSVTATTVNGTIDATSDLNAYYAAVQVSGGLLILIHVPHFSTHTVEIASSGSTGSTTPLLTTDHVGLILAGIGIVAVVAAVLVLYRKRKP
ncbi:MAG: hypothetical protein M1267_02545 [Candidatus Thermoplasmatota archaeon]|nr:hypothetical protein [Candidatus Thermoplasmatota archaeon]